MIRKPNNWNEVQEFSDRQKLPLGAYVCKVKQVRIQDNSFGSQLCMLFDISEGEYAGYFQKDYNGNTAQDKKWRGVLRVWVPNDDGSDKDEMTKRGFKGMVTAFEKSNPGYVWDWNENSLVNKQVGILFRNGITTASRAGQCVLSAPFPLIPCAMKAIPFPRTSP